MKPKMIVGLVLLIGFSSLLLLSFGSQVGGYMDFAQAEATGSNAHVVGTWVAERGFDYDRERNVFSFYMKDEKGAVRMVELAEPKPANFEDAEQLVIEGRAQGNRFAATHILVKCPSKYNETTTLQTTAAAS